MICGILTDEQREMIKDKPFANACLFNPVKDFYNNWVIFEGEMACTYPEFAFVNSLPLIEFVPVIIEWP